MSKRSEYSAPRMLLKDEELRSSEPIMRQPVSTESDQRHHEINSGQYPFLGRYPKPISDF
ncbi:MAG: hypothetical protein M1813_002726 [Trichoglossum hirsutum]|nr:MAG: hypothetical protein M1813_002726 [Trichoglossum hirsutum]